MRPPSSDSVTGPGGLPSVGWATAPRSARILRTLVRVALACVASAVMLRVTVRDALPWISVLVLATPWVVDGVAAAVVAVLAWRLRDRRVATLAAGFAVFCGAMYATQSFVRNPPREEGAYRGLVWNVRAGLGGWPQIAAVVREVDPDVAWLTEADPESPAGDYALLPALPGHAMLSLRPSFRVLVRGEAVQEERVRLGPRSRLVRLRVSLRGRELGLIGVDLASDPFRPRADETGRALRTVLERLPRPLLVVGDFNTPRDSAAFDAWRGQLVHGFESAGSGLDATWPWPLPVLAIDHVWAGGGVTIRTCELLGSPLSDHRAVAFTFDLP